VVTQRVRTNTCADTDLVEAHMVLIRLTRSKEEHDMPVTDEIPKKVLTDLLVRVMQLEKAYAHEQVGARNDRRAELKRLINRLVSESLEKK